MSTKYKPTDTAATYFSTSTVVDWIEVFTRGDYKTILLDRLRHCQQNQGLQIRARVLMTNHLQDSYARYNTDVPDYEAIRNEFYDTLELLQNKTMLWAIAYSRLDKPVKENLLKQHYRTETVNSFFYICCRLQMVGMLHWLSRQ
ncbi:MAG: hypothetical protein M9933_18610 [Chitinophagaceae bacterium]|nr:hypothetical protein [Chitinophagaceae bacterium]